MPEGGWLPKIQTLGPAIQEHGDWSALTGMEALALLYTTWLNLPTESPASNEPKSFTAFMPWGQIALRDFNEIDQHLLDAQAVFQNLCDIEGIEDWSFGNSETLKAGQVAFLRQYLQLGPLYSAFTSALAERRIGYSGWIARETADNSIKLPYHQVFVAGMSALTPAELKFLKRYEDSQQLTWVWDGDASYVAADAVEAGLFMRAHFQRKGTPVQGIPSSIASAPPHLFEVNCSSSMMQCQYIRETIGHSSSAELARTAIILPDGAQLPLLLQSLPSGLQDHYNVTMGLSWNETPARSFLRTVHFIVTRGRARWHHDDIRTFLGEPLLNQAYPDPAFQSDAQRVLNQMAANKWAWVDLHQIQQLSEGPVAECFAALSALHHPEATPLVNALAAWSQDVGRALEAHETANPWATSGWEKVVESLSVAGRFCSEFGVLQTSEDVWSFLFNSLQAERIDLLGEPEAGLQIMGLIESRALDYDRVFLMDCNEGTLPKSSPPDSFIPFDLRAMWNLPGRHEREAIFAYYTYRLLNRSREVHFLYRGQDEAAEKSRYLLQFSRSFRPNGEDLLAIQHRRVHTPLPASRPEIQPIQWTAWGREQLQQWAANGISPSGWNTFMNCKRDFYYKYLLNLHEQDEFEDEMSASTFGTVVHQVLEDGFKQLLDHPLQREDLVQLRNDIPPLLRTAVEKGFNLSLTESGENYLHFAMAEATLNKLIDVEIKEMDRVEHRHVTLVEEPLSHSFPLPHPVFSSVRLHGKADRIDVESGEFIVTDYKTGAVTENELVLKSPWTEKLASGKAGKALQLLIYAAIALETLGPNRSPIDHVQSGIRSGKNARVGLLSLSIDGRVHIDRSDAQQLLHWLVEQLEAVHDDTHGIEHASQSLYCAYCTVLDPPIKHF